MRTGKELCREIADHLVATGFDCVDGSDDALHQTVADGQRNRDVPIVRARLRGRPTLRVTHVIEDRPLD